MSMFLDTINKMSELSEIEIHHPIGCFIALCKRQNLPKAEAVLASEDFSILSVGKKVTALDVYFALAEIIEAYINNQIALKKTVSPAKMIYWQEQLSRILTYNIKDYDHECSWE